MSFYGPHQLGHSRGGSSSYLSVKNREHDDVGRTVAAENHGGVSRDRPSSLSSAKSISEIHHFSCLFNLHTTTRD